MDWMRELFSWEVVGWTVGVLAPGGLGLLALNDYRLTKTCFMLCGLMLEGKVIMWGIETPLSLPGRIFTSALLFALIGIGVEESWRYVDSKASKTQAGSLTAASATPISPVAEGFSLTMIIDDVRKDFVQFHFVIHNGGKGLLLVERVTYSTNSIKGIESSDIVRREIPAGSEVVSNGVGFISDLLGQLTVHATFRQDNAPLSTAQFAFDVRAIDLHRGAKLEPSSRRVLPGDASLSAPQTVLEILRRPEGTISFSLSETGPDGKPSPLSMWVSPTRYFSFDPMLRKVWFSMDADGKVKRLSMELPPKSKNEYRVVLAWGKQGVHLYVDGKEAKQG